MIAWCQHIKTFFLFFFSGAVDSASRRQERTIVRSQVRTRRCAWRVSTNNCEYCQAGRKAGQPDSPPDPEGVTSSNLGWKPNSSPIEARKDPITPDPSPIKPGNSEQLFGSRSRSQPDHQCAIEIVRKLLPRSGQVQTPIMPTFNYFCLSFLGLFG